MGCSAGGDFENRSAPGIVEHAVVVVAADVGGHRAYFPACLVFLFQRPFFSFVSRFPSG